MEKSFCTGDCFVTAFSGGFGDFDAEVFQLRFRFRAGSGMGQERLQLSLFFMNGK